jgi:hypothetical protein
MPESNTQEFARHPDYTEALPVWVKCRAAVKGERAVKALGAAILPKLGGMTDIEYDAYKRRAMFYAASGRTVQGLTGMLLRKPPELEPDDSEFVEDVGSQGEDLGTMLLKSLNQLLTVGRVGFLVDADQAGESATVVPYVTQYIAENILNWYSERLDGEYKLTMVVLQEQRETPPNTLGERFVRTIYRVLRFGTEPPEAGQRVKDVQEGQDVQEVMAEADGNGFYWQEVWIRPLDEKGNETPDLMLEEVIIPRRAGGVLWDEIPFAFLNSMDVTSDISQPPLEAMIDVNLSHYRNSADLEHGRHYTALPTPYAFGGQSTEPMKIGSSIAWSGDDKDIQVGILEFTGKGLGHIADGMKDKEQLMAVLGSRLLEDQKAGVETAAALSIRLAGDGSVMETLSILTSHTWTKLLQWTQTWVSTSEPTASLELNTDFSPKRLDAPELTALGQQFQLGNISWSTYFYNLQQGEIIPTGVTEDEEFAEIQDGGPATEGFPTPGVVSDDAAPDDATISDAPPEDVQA